MSEIKVGEYVRTKKGYIAKIIEIDNYIWFNETINKESGMAVYELSKLEFENLVTKHSFNIIDLIEEGDYVNGWCIDGVSKDENGHIFYVQNYEVPGFNEREIKSIVTKERFTESEYKLC